MDRRQFLKGSLAVTTAAMAGPLPLGAASGSARPAARPHVAVVGAGAFGGWTALALVRRGARVTLVDAWGPGNARASSGGETRVIRAMYGPDRIYSEWVRRSLELWRASERDWGEPLFRRTGALWMFGEDDGYARAALPLLADLGWPVETLDPEAAAARFPQIRFDGVERVYLEPEAGFLLARAGCQAVARAVVAAGGELVRAEARPGELAGDALAALVLADGTRLAADAYVFACGPWLGRVVPEIGAAISPTRQEVYFFGTPPGTPDLEEDRCPVWVDFGERLFYGIPGNQHRGFKVADDTHGPAADPTTMERLPTAAEVERLRAFLARRFPALAGAPLVEARVCQYENSPDGHYLIDRHPRAANAWVVGGGSGHGYKLAPALGEHVAALALGETAPLPKFSLARLGERVGARRSQYEERGDATT